MTLRVNEGLTRARAEGFNENRIQELFNDIQPFYDQLDFNNFHNLNYNCDKTGISSVPSVSAKVVALKGSCQVQKLPVRERGALTTDLATINAAGDNLPLFLIFKGTKILDVSKFPLGTKVHCSKSGNKNGILQSPENVKLIMEPPAKKVSHKNTVTKKHKSLEAN